MPIIIYNEVMFGNSTTTVDIESALVRSLGLNPKPNDWTELLTLRDRLSGCAQYSDNLHCFFQKYVLSLTRLPKSKVKGCLPAIRGLRTNENSLDTKIPTYSRVLRGLLWRCDSMIRIVRNALLDSILPVQYIFDLVLRVEMDSVFVLDQRIVFAHDPEELKLRTLRKGRLLELRAAPGGALFCGNYEVCEVESDGELDGGTGTM
ncbi:MAG: hypothetical protein Q9218_001899 [Villophora microphyllina]